MAVSFNEIDQYLSIADSAAMTLPDADWTLAGWMKPDSLAGTGSQFVVSWNHFNYLPSLNWWFREASHPSEAGKIKFRLKDTADQIEVYSPTAVITTMDWYHLCLVRSSYTFTQYVNGVAAGYGVLGKMDDINPSVPWLFGAVTEFDPDSYFGGRLAEWAKWDRALGADERAALAAGLAPIWYPTGLAWWLPLYTSHEEKIVPLSVTDSSGGPAAHPPQIKYPPPNRRGIAWQLNPLGIGV
ncbi:MAG: LamG domain-containing protein [Pirellulales bacterium]|nr:LamG domain-containing protein [Pirellulales bacterium]